MIPVPVVIGAGVVVLLLAWMLLRRANIGAIKHVREVTGLRLKEAKDLVETIEAGNPV